MRISSVKPVLWLVLNLHHLLSNPVDGAEVNTQSRSSLTSYQSMWAELSGENFHSPLTWVFAPPAPPLKVAADRSAQFRSPLTYNFIPLRWNRSTLAQIENSSACLTPAVFNRSLTPETHCLRGGRGAGLLRDCCGKNLLHFYSVAGLRLRCGWTMNLIRAYSAGSVAALIC